MGQLLDLAVRAAQGGDAEAKLPMEMLSELFEGQAVRECEATWAMVEARSEVLTAPFFMGTGKGNTKPKLTMLKIANNLLRRLSQARAASANSQKPGLPHNIQTPRVPAFSCPRSLTPDPMWVVRTDAPHGVLRQGDDVPCLRPLPLGAERRQRPWFVQRGHGHRL